MGKKCDANAEGGDGVIFKRARAGMCSHSTHKNQKCLERSCKLNFIIFKNNYAVAMPSQSNSSIFVLQPSKELKLGSVLPQSP